MPVPRRIALTILPWLVLSLVFLPSALLLDRDAAQPFGWRYQCEDYLVCFQVWALFTPLIGRVLKQQSLDWPPRLQACLVHLACALAMTAVHVLAMAAFASLVPSERPFIPYAQNLVRQLLELGPTDLVLYAGVVASLTAWTALSRYHARERTITQARLDALKARIEPHFLFNTLNALSELVYHDPEAADRAITRLAGLLRQLIDRDEHEQALADEIAMLRDYAAIQQILLGDRLDFHCDVPSALLRARVPTLLLQPLFENAIRHGIAQLRRGGRVEVAVAAERERLIVRIRNDGPVHREAQASGGIGLGNTRARLHALHGSQQQLTLAFPPEGGAQVRIELPLRFAAGPQ